MGFDTWAQAAITAGFTLAAVAAIASLINSARRGIAAWARIRKELDQ